jgi:peptide/nickel transport system permease protein
MGKRQNQLLTPGFYVRRRMLNNKPAMFGLGFISLALVISVMGYLLMPDQSPDANDGAVQVQKQAPGFTATFLKIRKNRNIRQRSLLGRAFFGQESAYMIVPVSSHTIEGDEVRAKIFGKENYYQTYSLIDAVKAIEPGSVEVLDSVSQTIGYRSPDGENMQISRADLVKEFETNNLEKRTYWLGSDRMGRDMLSRLLFGTRISLSIGFLAVLISMLLGMSLGSLAGFFGGKVDMIILWFMSVVWSIPGIILVIAISMALQSRGVWVAFVAVGLTMWVEVARVIRGQIMAIKQKLFVEAARAFGIRSFNIMFVHILPNIAGPLIVIATANFAAAILLEAGLSFLGLGVQPPTPSWGVMIYEGFQAIGTKNSLHLILFPGLAICTLVLSFNLLGNGLRDAYDPKTLLE